MLLARAAAARPESKDAAADAHDFVCARARELYDTVARLVERDHVPEVQGGKGGIIVMGWSLGTLWATAFLAQAPGFAAADQERGKVTVDLSKYVRRVVAFGEYRSLPCLVRARPLT